jgi:hypothetical protein
MEESPRQRLIWHRRKGLGGLYARLPDKQSYDITLAPVDGYYLSLVLPDDRRITLGHFGKQVEAKRFAEARE